MNPVNFVLFHQLCQLLKEAGIYHRKNITDFLPRAGGLIYTEHILGAVIALGCVIRGETTHYDYVCQSVERGLSRLQLKSLKPVVFGVLTTENYEQALAWAGGQHGHKGEEAAWVALRMLTLREELKGE